MKNSTIENPKSNLQRKTHRPKPKSKPSLLVYALTDCFKEENWCFDVVTLYERELKGERNFEGHE